MCFFLFRFNVLRNVFFLINSLSEHIGTIDFVEKGTENVVFRTCDDEKDRVVFQIGTSDAVRALTAAQLV